MVKGEKRTMPDYKKLYYDMFNTVTDTIETLQKAQRKAEEDYLRSCEAEEKQRKVIKLTDKKK